MIREPARAHLLWTILSLALPVTFGHTTAYRNLALVFSAAIHFNMMKCCGACSAVLRHPPSSRVAVVHWSALIPKALRSSRRHPVPSFSCLPTQPAPPISSRNITHFGSLVSFMRAADPTNRIRLLRIINSMLSLPVLIRLSGKDIGWSVRLYFRQPTNSVCLKYRTIYQLGHHIAVVLMTLRKIKF